jgi:hypothetical protein
VGLSALMVNQITKARFKLPASDVAHFFQYHKPPEHWFIGLGYYVGDPVLASNHAPLRLGFEEQDGSQSTVLIKHAFATIIGNLFTIVDVVTDCILPFGPPPNGPAYVPYIIGVQPRIFKSIPFPPPSQSIIWGPGQFWPGTHALRIARMAIDPLIAAHKALGSTSIT